MSITNIQLLKTDRGQTLSLASSVA